jgi:hypothetical protein
VLYCICDLLEQPLCQRLWSVLLVIQLLVHLLNAFDVIDVLLIVQAFKFS